MGISLKIKGNKFSNSGVGADLVAVGNISFPVLDQQYAGAGQVTDIIIVRHLTDKSVYSLMTKNVTPADSSRNGTLIVSVCVPKGRQVVGLFNMLIELSNTYKSNYMTFDGTMYHFTPAQESPDIFRSIINRYNVVAYPFRPVTMTDDVDSVAYMFMTSAQIREVFEDPMRREFVGYGQIVFAPVQNPAACCSTFSLPPSIVRTYKILVNGRQTSQTISDPNKNVAITIGETPKTEAASISFTLAGARAGTNSNIIVDDFNQVIHVKLQPTAKVLPPVDPHEPYESRKKRSTLPFVFGGLFTIAIIAAACYFLGLFDNKSVPSDPGATEALDNDTISDAQARKFKDMQDKSEDNGTADTTPENQSDKAEDISAGNVNGNQRNAEVKVDGDKNVKNDKKENSRPSDPVIPEALKADYETHMSVIGKPTVSFKQLQGAENFVKNNREELQETPLAKAIDAHNNIINALKSNETAESYRNSIVGISNNYKTILPDISKQIKSISELNDTELETFRLDFTKRKKGEIYKIK